MDIRSWFLLMTLVVLPLFLDYLCNRSSFFEKGRFDEIQENLIFRLVVGLIFMIAISGTFFFWWTIKKYTVLKVNTLGPFDLDSRLYSMGALPVGFGLIVAVCLIIGDFSILGIPPKILLWIVILIFGAMSIYGLRMGNRLLNQKLINKKDEKNE